MPQTKGGYTSHSFPLLGREQFERDIKDLLSKGHRIFDISIIIKGVGLTVLVLCDSELGDWRKQVQISQVEASLVASTISSSPGRVRVAWHPQGQYAFVIRITKRSGRYENPFDLLD